MSAALKGLSAGALAWALVGVAFASPPVRFTEEDGFLNIDLPIAAVMEDAGVTRITTRGDVDGKEVGFEVDFPSKVHPGNRTCLPVGSAQIRSLGPKWTVTLKKGV